MRKILETIFITIIFMLFLRENAYAMDVDYLCGTDRYETAALIADRQEYSSAVLVNGLALVDGLSASGLSGATNSPILLTGASKIPDVTLQRLQKVNNVYIVGGSTVISNDIEAYLRNSGKNVVRLGGSTRFDTSYKVADYIESIKGIGALYYVNGIKGEADAMSIAPVAASTGNPVILTDGQNTSYRRSVSAYSIGGSNVMNTYFEGFSERIGGSTRFETNINVIKKFFSNYEHVNLSKAYVLVDALTASSLKEPVILVSDTSDKRIIDGAKGLTVLGDVSDKAVQTAKAHLFGDTVVFYSQHQDDETIFAGSQVVDAIAARGKENVYVVLITDGNESGVFVWDRYKDLPTEQKSALRDNEFKAAVAALGVEEKNVIFLHQPESTVDIQVVEEQIMYFENNFPNVTHITHSYKYDNHAMHLSTGRLMNNLYANKNIQDCRFFARYDMINSIASKDLIVSVADSAEERTTIEKACAEYELDRGDMIREGIGYKSVQSLFLNLLSKADVPSYLHLSGI